MAGRLIINRRRQAADHRRPPSVGRQPPRVHPAPWPRARACGVLRGRRPRHAPSPFMPRPATTRPQDCFSQPGNVSLLEEPRAELTALFTLKLLFEQDVLTRPQLDKAVAHFALDALRYFAKYDSEALYPYIIFMVYFYKVHHKHGYLTLHPDSGKLVLDPSKTLLVLDEFAGTFERLLGLMDARDGAGLEALLFQDMAPEDDFVRAVVALVRAKGG